MSAADTGLLVIDVQEKLVPKICNAPAMVRNIAFLIDAARILEIPVQATEQYPKGLGQTVPELAEKLRTTRSAAALDLWGHKLAGAVVAIGNAPTALYHLLERIDAGAPRPAAILGIPVGFVGAAEAKDALAADPRGVPYLIVRGRLGGSAMTAAAVNALARPGL